MNGNDKTGYIYVIIYLLESSSKVKEMSQNISKKSKNEKDFCYTIVMQFINKDSVPSMINSSVHVLEKQYFDERVHKKSHLSHIHDRDN